MSDLQLYQFHGVYRILEEYESRNLLLLLLDEKEVHQNVPKK